MDLAVPLRSRRVKRALAVQQLNHALPTIGLIYAGVEALQRGAHGFELALAIVGMVTSVLLIVALARSIRAARSSVPPARHAHGIDPVHIWAAGVLFAEVGERWHLRHHLSRPLLLTALLTLGLGLLHGRMAALGERRRSLRLGGDEIYVGGRPFMAFRARWKDVAAVKIADRYAEIRTRAGHVRRIDLADLENAAEVRGALQEAQRRAQAAALAEQPQPR